jgi:hypothetical protein
MVIAGTKNSITQGANVKNGSIEATPLERIFHGPGKTHKNNPIKRRKAEITTHPVNELKKYRISFIIRDFIMITSI